MPVSYTNRKGQTYTLYQGQTRTGKPRYYFGRMGQSHDEAVTEIPPGFIISESVNGVVSLAKDRPSLILPEEVATIEAAVKQHPNARRYRVVVKHNLIEIYENAGPHFDALFQTLFRMDAEHASRLEAEEEHSAQYTPVLQFILLNPVRRQFGAKRMCYRSSVNGWLELMQTGSVAKLAHALVSTLDTDQFYELF